MFPTLVTVLGPILAQLLEKLIPDVAARKQAQDELLRSLSEKDQEVVLAQLAVNTAEAGSPSLFVSGWRPAVGWVCVAGLGYVFLLAPFLSWGCTLAGVGAPPALDTGELMTLLMGMLGMAGIRSYDKKTGPRVLFPGK